MPNNGLVKIELDNVQQGYALQHFNEVLEEAAADVVRRDKVLKARKVTLVVSMTPAVDEATGINCPEIDWHVEISVPGRKGSISRGFVLDGKLMVARNNNDARQRSFLEQEEDVPESEDKPELPDNLRQFPVKEKKT